MSTTTTYTGVRIVDMPDLGAVTDDSSVVGEHAGSGRFAATAFRTYVAGLGTGNIGRNLLHNPLFRVQQRGVGPFTTASAYTLDRWLINAALDTFSVQRNPVDDTSRTSIGDEAAEVYLANTFTGNAGAGATNTIAQYIENVQRLSGKTVTVSFYATAGASLKLGCSLDQNFGTGGSPSASVSGNGQSVTVTTTWARYSLTFTLPSISGKARGTNGNDYTGMNLWYSAGSNYTTRSGSVGVQSGFIAIWGVQLEVGSVATPLEKPDPPYDLANCQRFYQTGNLFVGGYNTAGAAVGYWQGLPVTMRAPPTVTPTYTTQTNCAAGIGGISAAGFQSTAVVTATGSCSAVGTFAASADL